MIERRCAKHMKNIVRKVVSCLAALSIMMTSIFCGNVYPANVSAAEVEPDVGGYLAAFIAKYEPNLGVEFAQFPSKEYTNTFRTDVIFYALSKDGETFTALNNNKAVLSPQNCYKMGSPAIFRKPDGTYGLLCSIDNNSDQIIIFDSEDLLFFENQRIVKLNDKGIKASYPTVRYDDEDEEYIILWEGKDGSSYETTSKDLNTFSEPVKTSYIKEAPDAELPKYADAEETEIFELTKEEYDRIERKFSKLHSVSLDISDKKIKPGESVTLPDKVDVVYSDGSTTPMNVTWETNGLDLKNLPVGEYNVKGKINADTDFNSPLAECRADPYAVYNEDDGYYYFTASNMNPNSANGGGAYNTIPLRRAESINDITDAKEVDIWTDRTVNGIKVTGWYWAPELHKIGDYWRILAQASVTENGNSLGSRQCIFTCVGDDLMDPDNWEYTGYIHNTTDGAAVGAFDTTYFELDGQSYYVIPFSSTLWLTTVDPDNPEYPTGPRVRLSGADRAYETNIGAGKAGYGSINGSPGQAIEEASSVLFYEDKIFIVYAGCTIDMFYCVCAIWAYVDDDLMNSASWHKFPYPLLGTQDLTTVIKEADYTKTDGTTNVTGSGDSGLLKEAEGEYKGTFGPGHNTFTVDCNGNPVIIYHARDWDDTYPGATGSNKYGLVDPGRHAYAKNVVFDAWGYPVCNMSSEEYLAKDLREFTLKITVAEDKKDDPQNTTNTNVQNTAAPTGTVDNAQKTSDTTAVVSKGDKAALKNIKYKVTSVAKNGTGTVTVIGTSKKTLKSVVIPATVKIKGKSFKVTAIGKKAFYKMKKLARVTVGKNVKKIGKQAFGGCPKLKKIINKSKYIRKISIK